MGKIADFNKINNLALIVGNSKFPDFGISKFPNFQILEYGAPKHPNVGADFDENVQYSR